MGQPKGSMSASKGNAVPGKNRKPDNSVTKVHGGNHKPSMTKIKQGR